MITAPLATALLLAGQAAPPAPAAASPAEAPAPAPAPPTSWPYDGFIADDYPASAIRGEEQGTVRYRVEIGPNGRVSGCAVTGSSGSAALDQATCRIVRVRARFVPARDSDGNGVPDTRDNGEVSWRLPRDD